MEPLTDEQVDERLAGDLSGWARADGALVREVTTADFAAAIELVNAVAGVAEECNHHPDILVHGWNKVKLSLTNPSAGGLTEVDFAMAGRFDAI
jgi:4a-hydroxytetrahydrobiopterin dehydratase